MANDESHEHDNDEQAPEKPDKSQLAHELGSLLMKALDLAPKAARHSTLRAGEPIPAEDMARALKRLQEAGWAFDENYPTAQLYRVSSAPSTSEQRAILEDLQEQYPYLPIEVAETSWSILTGNGTRPDIAKDDPSWDVKRAAVERFVLTEAARERFYLSACGKVPRLVSTDWEVVIKAAERGHHAAPSFPYALTALHVTNDVHGHDEHQTLTFAVGLQGLQRLIDELTELKKNLEHVSASLDGTTRGQEQANA